MKYERARAVASRSCPANTVTSLSGAEQMPDRECDAGARLAGGAAANGIHDDESRRRYFGALRAARSASTSSLWVAGLTFT